MEYAHADAVIDGDHRLLLTRVWAEEGEEPKPILFHMLNPSTADGTEDDPTIRRCVGFAKDWGYNILHVTNMFSFRATNPNDLWHQKQSIIHPGNLQVTINAMRMSKMLVCAWGDSITPKVVRSYDVYLDAFRTAFESALVTGCKGPMCLSTTKSGAPGHPLYQPRDTKPKIFAFEGWKPLMESRRA